MRRRIVSILKQVLAALSEAHHLDIIHRDLKPENIILEPMRTGGDFVKVVDFGLAKMRAESEKPSITSPGIVCGTPEYMSPEQGRGDPLDPRSDLYAMGVIFYQLLTGRLPFEADSPTQVVLMHLTKQPSDPRTVAPDRGIPQALAEVALFALAKDPNQRFSNADEFSESLTDSLSQIEGPVGSTRAVRGPETSLVKCPSCGTMNAATQKFCGECGGSTVAVTPSPNATPKRSDPAIRPTAAATEFAREEPTTATARNQLLDGDQIRFPLPLVGREEDLAWLEDRRNDARTSLVGARLVGDAGIGKTRLLREFLETSSAAGDTVVVTGPDPAWAEVSYYALRKAVQHLAGLPPNGGDPREWGAAGAEARRGLMDVFAIREPAGPGGRTTVQTLSPDERRFTAAEALRWSLIRASERAPGHRVIIAVDDLNHVDGASRNAFSDAISEPPLVAALLVATYAPGFDPHWPGDTAAARVLNGLSSTVVAKLLRATGSTSSPSLSGGRGIAPLYLDQLLRFMREQGGGAPARLADLIALRVERLPPHARRALQAVAVAGDNATPDSITPLLPDNTNLIDALMLLEGAAMLEVGGDGYRVSHPLLREVVLATIPAAVRRGLHAYAADYCEDKEAPIEVRALHECQAQNTFQALLLLESMSVRCSARGDVSGAVNSLRRGLELARRELFRGELDDPMRAVLIFSRKLGEALASSGDFTDAEGVLREALDMAGPSGKDRASVLGALAHVAHGRERKVEAQIYLREALELATQSGAHELVTSLEDLRRSIAV